MRVSLPPLMGFQDPLSTLDGVGQVVVTTLIELQLIIIILVPTTLPTIQPPATLQNLSLSTIPAPPIQYVAILTLLYYLIPKQVAV